MAYDVPAPYAQAIRSGLTQSHTVDAALGGVPIQTGMQPPGGTIVDGTKPGVRRLLSLDLAPEAGLYDALKLHGTTLTVTCHVTYTDQTTVDIPMGVFDLDQSSLDEGGGKISLTAPDKWVRIQRGNFVAPTASVVGSPVTAQILSLMRGALGASEPAVVLTSNKAIVPALTWDPSNTSRSEAIIKLATDAGLWCYFDRNGLFTVADVPQVKVASDWLIDASASGVLVSLSRQQDRTKSANVVVVSSSASGGALFPDQVVFDDDPTSPTYAGTDPLNHPELAGPFGVVVYRYSTPLDLGVAGAVNTGSAILSQTVGIASQASLSSVPIAAMDAFDALDVVGPQQRYDVARSIERHIADTVVHQLDIQQAQQIQGRSTRTDPYS